MAIVAAPAIAKESSAMMSSTDILGNGIFESPDGIRFPEATASDINFDSITVGNDYAHASGWNGPFPFVFNPAKAVNNLEVKKNQQVGEGQCCQALDSSCPCKDCSILTNVDQVHIGDRTATAFGNAEAVNNVKIVLNQAP